VTDERVAALEARVAQLAAGHGNAAASSVFAETRRNLATLTNRLDAAEARLTALEKGTPTAAPGAQGAPAADVLHGEAATATAAIAQLNERLAKLEQTNASPAQIADLTGKMATLQARVAALDADIARFAETQKGTMDAVNLRLATIEAALPANLAQRLEALTPKSDTATVEARVARLEAANAGDALHRAAAILALADLANAAADGKPFGVQLAALAAAEPDDAAIPALRPWAAQGVPTLAMLRARFPIAARNALDVERTATAPDFLSRLWTNLESLISIRRVGEVAGTDVESRLARAQVRVTAGELAAAVAEVAHVGPPASVPLAAWLRDARNRVALDRAVAQLDARVVRSLVSVPATEPAAPPAPVNVPSAAGSTPVPAQKPGPTQ
jgi:hypothetical protein